MRLNKERHRLNLAMTDRSKKRLDRLMSLTEADTASEVIRNALQIYEALIDDYVVGKRLFIQNRDSNKLVPYSPFVAMPGGSSDQVQDDKSELPELDRPDTSQYSASSQTVDHLIT